MECSNRREESRLNRYDSITFVLDNNTNTYTIYVAKSDAIEIIAMDVSADVVSSTLHRLLLSLEQHTLEGYDKADG